MTAVTKRTRSPLPPDWIDNSRTKVAAAPAPAKPKKPRAKKKAA